MKRFIKNRKGTAEVIGTILFIMILLFFFTNVYLWHDSATKDANNLYLEKVNSTFSLSYVSGSVIKVTAGGSDITLSRLWIIDKNGNHMYTDINILVQAGTSCQIDLSSYAYHEGNNVVNYPSGLVVRCMIINTLGMSESYTFQS